MRVLILALLPLALCSCLSGLLGDSMADTDYVISTPGAADRLATVVREVAVANGLRSVPPKTSQSRYVQAQYTNYAPGGAVSIWITLYTGTPTLIDINEAWTATRSEKHRRIARDLEGRLRGAGFVFHKPSGNEFVRLRDAHLKT